jgi:hypothetical protein
MNLTNGFPERTVALDLGDRSSVFCSLSWAGEVTQRGEVRTRPNDLEQLLSTMEPSRGSPSPIACAMLIVSLWTSKPT